MTDITLFRVKAMHFRGYSPGVKSESDKVWAAVLLKRASSDGRTMCYVSAWGGTGETIQKKHQPWTTAVAANKKFEDAVEAKRREGYWDIEFVDRGLTDTINSLPKRVPDSIANGDAARKAWRTRQPKPRSSSPVLSQPTPVAKEPAPPVPTPSPITRMRRLRNIDLLS
jgi:predicted DNA-binding WGR domain protein